MACKENEDAVGVFCWENNKILLAVADGVGGMPGGEAAARRVIEALAQSPVEPQDDPVGCLLTQVNQSLLADTSAGATTISALSIGGYQLTSHHAGDSAALVIGKRGKIKLQTISHSPVGVALASGQLTEHQALFHSKRHLLSNMVGDTGLWVERSASIALSASDTVVVASDGLWDNLFVSEVVELARKGPLETVAGQLGDLARQRMATPGTPDPAKPDDLSFILYRMHPIEDSKAR
jgi:protein phosphatase